MVFTDRDQRLLQAIQSYAILTTRQIAKMIFPGVAITTVLRRLRALEAGGYIQRIEGLVSTERAWGLTEWAGKLDPQRPGKVHFPRHSLDHDLKLTALRMQLEGKGIALSWIPEHEIRAKMARAHGLREVKRRVIPDGILSLEREGEKVSLALELELHVKNQSRYRQILRDYQSKKNLYALWYVVATKGIGRALEKAQKECYFSGPFLFWSLLADVMREPREARAYCAGKTFLLRQLFRAPAHPPAQEVSTPLPSAQSEIPKPTP
jgi:DNA-binding Lrp family transcriptional regulator